MGYRMAFFRMVGVVKTFLTENHQIFQNDAIAEASYQELVSLDEQVQNYLNKIAENVTGVAAEKQMKRDELEEIIWFVVCRIKSYAAVTEKVALQKSVNYSRSILDKVSGKLLLGYGNNVYTIADAHKTALAAYGVTNTVLSDLQSKIQAFSEILNAPASAWSTKREAFPALRNLYNKLRNLITNRLDNDMFVFASSHPDFYNGYLYARVIYDEPSQKIALVIKTIDQATNHPIEGVNINIPDSGIQRQTSGNGRCEIQNLSEGEHTIDFEHPAYQPHSETVIIVNNQTTVLNVALIHN